MRQHGWRRARDARAQIIALAASLALLAGCASGGKPADEKPSGREQALVDITYSEALAVSLRPDAKR